MAGDWIKVEKATARKPEVLRIADLLNIHPDHAFGLCVRFWSWCDDNLTDGHCRPIGVNVLDSIFGQAGFVEALIQVGWLRAFNGSFEIPHFDRHLSTTAKKRGDNAKRQQQSRHRNVTQSCDISATESVVVNERDKIPEELRRQIIERDGRCCRYCGWSYQVIHFGPYQGATMHIDHIIPVSRGGQTIAANLVTSCSVCNMHKANRTPEEAGMIVTDLCDNCVTREEERERKRRESNSDRTDRKGRSPPGQSDLDISDRPPPLDLSGIDLSQVEYMARKIGEVVTPATDDDRRAFLRYAVLTQISFNENWLYEGLGALNGDPSRKSRAARFVGALQKGSGMDKEDFNALARQIDVNDDLWSLDVLKVHP